jgi:SAM-dependent methyltransferase
MRTQWNDAAAGWDRHGAAIRDWLRNPTEAMLKLAHIHAGQTVLDVAAGTGDQTIDIAARVGVKGAVVATDISPNILSFTLGNAAWAGHQNVRIHVADAEDLQLDDATFDAAVCRLGLMFLPDPLAGVSQIHSVLKPDGWLCSIVFAGPEANPCLRIMMATALRHAGPPPRDPFQPGGLVSLGKPGMMGEVFQRAGFRAVATTPMDAPFRMPATADYLAFIRASAGPILQILAPLDDAARAAAWADMAAQLEVYQTDSGWIGPNALLLITGQR